jgi:anionic cell wall polymer biosynthesis LytR-Cps2A-Psr (LCP) family protein
MIRYTLNFGNDRLRTVFRNFKGFIIAVDALAKISVKLEKVYSPHYNCTK